MTIDELLFLTSHFDPRADPAERGEGRSYFLRTVDWRPATGTRILRVQSDRAGNVDRIRLYASPDNNNSVLVVMPLEAPALRQRVADEIAQFERQTEAVARVAVLLAAGSGRFFVTVIHADNWCVISMTSQGTKGPGAKSRDGDVDAVYV